MLLRITYTCMSQPKDTSSPVSSKQRESRGTLNKSTIFTGLVLFLGLSWILSQSAFIRKIKQHFPSTAEEEQGKMSNKRTVGYFVCPLLAVWVS
jgi:hypothetical protein